MDAVDWHISNFFFQTKSEGEALKRQSAALLQSAASDSRLTKALFEIENLKIETDKMIAERDDKVNVLFLTLQGQ